MIQKVKALLGLLKTEPITDRDMLAEVASRTALTELQRDTLKLQMDAELQGVTDKYAGRIEALQREIDSNKGRIHDWAKANRAEFGGKQSLFVFGHELKFRKSAEAVGYTEELKEEDVVHRIINLPVPEGADVEAPTLADLVLRVEATLDKNATKREWRLNTDDRRELLKTVGIRMVEKESFEFIPNRADLETVAPAADRQEAA